MTPDPELAAGVPATTPAVTPITPPTPIPSRRTALSFLGIATGNFLVLLDASILNVALPDMRRDLHAPAAALPWTVDAYTVVFAGLMLAAGAIADRFGARRVYIASLVSFAAICLLSAASPDIGTLIAGRALLGVAAAGLVPASLALLAGLYPDPVRRTRAIGTWAGVTTLGLVAGPVLGGLLVSAGGWRLVLLVNPPIALLGLLAARRLDAPRPQNPRRIDRAGLALSILTLGALTFGLVDGGTAGWSRPLPWIALALAAIAAAALVFAEHRVAHPALPPALISLGRVRAAMIAGAAANFVFYGILFALTQWLQNVRGLDPLDAGLAMLPGMVVLGLCATQSGRLIARFGARHLIYVGLAVDALAGVLLALVGSHTPLVAIIGVQFVIGIGGPLVIPTVTAELASATPPHLAATGQGALNTARQAGSALGVAVLGTLAGPHSSGPALAAGSLVALAVIVLANRAPSALHT